MDFAQYTNSQLDEIYYHTVGYRPISEDGATREEVIAILNEWEIETGSAPKVPTNINQF